MECWICKKPAEAERTSSRKTPFQCKTCGDFAITDRIKIQDELRPYLSAATRQASERGRPLTVTSENFLDLAEIHQGTTVSEKLDKILAFIAAKTKVPGSGHIVLPKLDYPMVDARDDAELQLYLGYLVNKGLLMVEFPGPGIAGGKYALTIDGWRQMEPVLRAGGEPGRCFVASWLDDENG